MRAVGGSPRAARTLSRRDPARALSGPEIGPPERVLAPRYEASSLSSR